MTDFRKMYGILFNAVTNAVRYMEQANYGLAADVLKAAQCCCEELYLCDETEDDESEL